MISKDYYCFFFTFFLLFITFLINKIGGLNTINYDILYPLWYNLTSSLTTFFPFSIGDFIYIIYPILFIYFFRKTRDIIDQFIEKSREIKESNDIFDLEDDHSKNNPRLTRVKQPHLINNHFFNLIKNSQITKALKDLLGNNILLKSF